MYPLKIKKDILKLFSDKCESISEPLRPACYLSYGDNTLSLGTRSLECQWMVI